MTPERWQRVKNTLATALEFPDEQGRDAFVRSACADDTALRREVESLLAQSHDELESVGQVIGVRGSGPALPAEGGRKIGNYELVRELGRGGMGTVWLARRADRHFEKTVAIKLLKRGTDTDEVLRRFQTERQILARLEHPNIARLLDGGITDDDLPYFVMEYVEGVRVTDFVRERHAPIRQRLELFQKICAAVQFAHQNLVVHRDLKPANILATADGEPKLLDFGIAKLLAPEDATFEVTLAEHQRLTPAYASPEQVRGDPVTTISDVYTLGAILYEILSGQPAHRFGDRQPTQTEIQRVVCNEAPLRPSAAATEANLKKQLRGDLDTILLRALAKDPERRYRGAGQLADDLHRYLEARPVRARPDTAAYRTAKFVQRNKTTALTGVLVLVTLVAGTVATVIQARRAERQSARAERRFKDLREISNSLMFELHNAIKDLPGALAARQLIISRALEYLDSLAREAGDDASLKSELATAYSKIGLVTFDVQQAIDSHRKAAALNEQLVQTAPKNTTYRKQLSDSYDHLSDLMKIAGRSTDAIDFARRSLDLMRPLAAANPADDKLQSALAERYLSLGIVLDDAGQYALALETERAALQLQQKVNAHRPDDRETARDLGGIYANLSDVSEHLGDYAAALEYGRPAEEAAKKEFDAEPGHAGARRDMWAALHRTGRQLAATGDTEKAFANYARAVELIEGLAAADPNDTGHQRWLAVTYFDFADLLVALNRNDEALAHYAKAIAIAEKLVTTDPDRVEARRDLALMKESLGLLYAKLHQPDRALQALEQAKASAEFSAQHDPQNARIRTRVAKITGELDGLLREEHTH
jgi:non-specific serine/threonine protein kinase/serine/threonine-protein kinase